MGKVMDLFRIWGIWNYDLPKNKEESQAVKAILIYVVGRCAWISQNRDKQRQKGKMKIKCFMKISKQKSKTKTT